MKTSEIVTAIIAAYGAVLSTIVFLRQLVRDRVKIKLTIQRDREIVGDPRYHNMTLTVVTVANVGRRPSTITNIGAYSLYPNENFVAIDSVPRLPAEITEGQYIECIVDQAGLDFSTLDYWAAWDSHGRVHKLHEASLLKHWKSKIQLKRSLRKKKAAQEQLLKAIGKFHK